MKAALRFGASKMACLKYNLRNTVTMKYNGEKVNECVYWPLTQWLVELVSTASQFHFLSHLSTLTSTSDINSLYHINMNCLPQYNLLVYGWFAIHTSMRADAHTSIKK